jgi:hypothetical protein
MRYVAYRNLIGVSHTEAEAKAEAEEIQVCILREHRYAKTQFCLSALFMAYTLCTEINYPNKTWQTVLTLTC